MQAFEFFFPSHRRKKYALRKASRVLDYPESQIRIRRLLHSRVEQRQGVPHQSHEYVQLESRTQQIYRRLNELDHQKKTATGELEEKQLLDEADRISKRQEEMLLRPPVYDIHYVRDLARVSSRYALFRMGVDHRSTRNKLLHSKIEAMVTQSPWLYQLTDMKPALVSILGRRKVGEFFHFYQQYYRAFSAREWKLATRG